MPPAGAILHRSSKMTTNRTMVLLGNRVIVHFHGHTSQQRMPDRYHRRLLTRFPVRQNVAQRIFSSPLRSPSRFSRFRVLVEHFRNIPRPRS